jgi:ABC-type uncharacterized transport system permease subunit
LPILATLAALIVGAVMLLLLKVNPIEAYKAMWEGAFGSQNALAETLVKATPLLLVGLGICISFRGNVINIGGEGQMIVGAILGTLIGITLVDWSGWIVIPVALLVGFVGGAIWGGIPGLLKAYFNVNEILSTVMMNAIAVDGKVLGTMSLPIAGLLSEEPVDDIIANLEEINQIYHNLGGTLPAPFMTISFIGLPTVPDLGLTDKGLVDVLDHALISSFVE